MNTFNIRLTQCKSLLYMCLKISALQTQRLNFFISDLSCMFFVFLFRCCSSSFVSCFCLFFFLTQSFSWRMCCSSFVSSFLLFIIILRDFLRSICFSSFVCLFVFNAHLIFSIFFSFPVLLLCRLLFSFVWFTLL